MYKCLEKVNTSIYNTGINIQEFFKKYRDVLIISFIAGILINSIDIFTFKFGVDSAYGPYTEQFVMQRYGSLILHNLFPFLSYNIISQLTGVISLIFAALIIISRHNVSNTGKNLFIIIFISSTYFTYLQHFFFQSAYNFIGLLFAAAAFRLIENNKNIFMYLLAVFLLFIGVSSYQSNVSVFLSVMMLNVILNFINDKNIEKAFMLIIKSTLILLVSLIIYYIVYKMGTVKIRSYFTDQILWVIDNADYKEIIIKITKFIFINIWFYLYTAVTVLYAVFNFKKIKERLFFIFLSILFILAVYSLIILMGNINTERTRTPLAIFPAFIFLLLYIFKDNNILKSIAVIFALIIISVNTSSNIKLQNTAKLMYEQDKMTAAKILDIIYTKYPEIFKGEYKIAFYGSITPNKHYLKQSSGSLAYTSFFCCGRLMPHRIYGFLRLMGFPEKIKLNSIIINKDISRAPDDLKKLIESMPVYPSSNCAELYEDTVFIKLSD